MSRPATHEQHLLAPDLPFDMGPRIEKASRDVRLLQFVDSATQHRDVDRRTVCRAAFGADYDAVRRLAGRIKQHALDHLDRCLERFIDQAEARGTHVHFAATGRQANEICVEIARAAGVRRCVKAKSMVTEETRLAAALERAGVEVVETDLGEFIVQLDGDAPSHIVAPMIHKDRASAGRTFQRELGVPYTDDPETLTAIARAHLREKYRAAELGITGGNFLVAETGTLVVCTNEGNADMCMNGPRVHVAVVGIEKLVPRLEDLPVLLKLLARSAAGQPLTIYTSLISGPRRAGEHDGPDELHVVLVDNGRSEILRAETRELLRCIRCGACLNACPVYRKVGGGHAYGAVYSGPIGATITPLLKGLPNYPDLPHASSLCGACHQACPVDIDIPGQLIRLRTAMVAHKVLRSRDRFMHRAWAASLREPAVYRLSMRIQRAVMRGTAGPDQGPGPYGDRRWIGKLPGPLAGWTEHRDFPAPPSASFRDWWGRRDREGTP